MSMSLYYAPSGWELLEIRKTVLIPNIVNVDFWSTGDVLEVVNEVTSHKCAATTFLDSV